MVPLAMVGSLVLLLSGLSLQGMVLQGRHLQALELRRQQGEDRLASAAQVLVGQLQGPYRCLRSMPSSAWQRGALPVDCPPELDPAPLSQWQLDGSVVELISWDPTADGAVLHLQERDGALQRRFRLGPTGLQEQG